MQKRNGKPEKRGIHFNFRHLTILFIVLIIFQIILTFLNKRSITDFLNSTQEWYRQDSAERIANLTTTNLELIIESISAGTAANEYQRARAIQSFDIILNQQYLQNNISEVYILVSRQDSIFIIEDGRVFFYYLFQPGYVPPPPAAKHKEALILYRQLYTHLNTTDQIQTVINSKEVFHTFVPFGSRGEKIGAVYMKNTPDFSLITNQIISSFDETAIIYLSLILLGLVAMYFISGYTVKERDEAQETLLEEHETHLKKQITYEKELSFTKRIYHTHHKAEKIMGFIKEDLRQLSADNFNEIKYRVTKYSNFISRVIYDMKWFDPPVQTIRNRIFATNLNEVIEFIVNHIFNRISTHSHPFTIELQLDKNMPIAPVNEFVVWEIFEPLIQNAIEHNIGENLIITVSTKFTEESNESFIFIADNGKGISPHLLEPGDDGNKLLFHEHASTKEHDIGNVGYGCYIAYAISKRCGWDLDAKNNDGPGCTFIIRIRN